MVSKTRVSLINQHRIIKKLILKLCRIVCALNANIKHKLCHFLLVLLLRFQFAVFFIFEKIRFSQNPINNLGHKIVKKIIRNLKVLYLVVPFFFLVSLIIYLLKILARFLA